jgi:hypothetical protein
LNNDNSIPALFLRLVKRFVSHLHSTGETAPGARQDYRDANTDSQVLAGRGVVVRDLQRGY